MKNKIVRIALAFFAIFTMTITGAMADTLEKAKTTGKFTLAYTCYITKSFMHQSINKTWG